MDRLYREGKFEHFGVSSLPAHEVQTIYDICARGRLCVAECVPGRLQPDCAWCGGWPVPDAAQAQHRLLRLGSLGGGYFSRPVAELRQPLKGSPMDEMSVVGEIYVSDTRIKLLENLKEACDRRGMAMKEAMLRWFMHRSALGKEDGVILGASSAEQAEENYKACEGGQLPDEVRREVCRDVACRQRRAVAVPLLEGEVVGRKSPSISYSGLALLKSLGSRLLIQTLTLLPFQVQAGPYS